MIQALTIMLATYFIVRLLDTYTKTIDFKMKFFSWVGILVIVGCVIAIFMKVNEVEQAIEQIMNGI
ncbi:MAG: hypothetical protein ACOC6D_03570 [Atribacterota bacterium]